MLRYYLHGLLVRTGPVCKGVRLCGLAGSVRFFMTSWESYEPIVDKASFKISKGLINAKLSINKNILYQEYMNLIPINERINTRPSIGSIVEFMSPLTDTLKVGVIISDDAHFFKKNSYKVFCMTESVDEGSEEVITTDQIHFYMNEFVKHELLYQSLSSVNGYSKETLNVFLKQFVLKSHDIVDRHAHLIPVIQAFYSKSLIPQQLDLLAVSKFLKSKIKYPDREPNIEFFIFGLHLHFQKDIWNYSIVKTSNFILEDFKSSLIPNNVKYFVNSMNEAELMEHASTLSDDRLEEIRLTFLEHIARKPDEYSTYLNYLQDPYDYRDIHSIITLMKRYLNFGPKMEVDSILSKCLKDICDITPQNIYTLLTNSLNPNLNESSLVLDYQMNNPISIPYPVVDDFSHLRKEYHDIAFGIPSSKLFNTFNSESITEFAVSLNTKNPKVWKLNIHIPDIASTIGAKGKQMRLIENKIKDFSSPYQKSSLFNDSTLHNFGFRQKAVNNRAITISISYNLKESKRWNASKASISLTNLQNLKIISISELNKIWKSRIPNMNLFNISNFFKKLFSSSGEPEMSGQLDSDQIESINNFLTMIDLWHSTRSQEKGTLENPFPLNLKSSPTELDAGSTESYSYVNYIAKEIELILSRELYKYSQENEDLILLTKNQSLLNDHVMDSIDIKSKTIMPNYETSKFNEIIFLKDEMMLTPYQNYVAALQFLKPIEITTSESKSEFVSKGIDSGFIECLNPLTNYESILNHWQVLNHLQKQFLKQLSTSPSKKYKSFDLTKLYPKHTIPKFETSQELLKYYNLKIKSFLDFMKYKELNDFRHLKLTEKGNESIQTTSWDIYRCIILNLISENKANAWCFELSLQVEIQLNQNNESIYQVGDQIICNKVIHLDQAESRIVLEN